MFGCGKKLLIHLPAVVFWCCTTCPLSCPRHINKYMPHRYVICMKGLQAIRIISYPPQWTKICLTKYLPLSPTHMGECNLQVSCYQFSYRGKTIIQKGQIYKQGHWKQANALQKDHWVSLIACMSGRSTPYGSFRRTFLSFIILYIWNTWMVCPGHGGVWGVTLGIDITK